ncbi:hypothetical protein HPB49_011669 [Dermacentor silvarum]|uniref:Uncharacterized protein n=1 Tax=Dermacentor silvarum TaxID=543639 RepID=A0ACB8DP84_DERSI|nr:hypothetical protein HPB49_011669 [Dermacentor silvarum]
MAVTTVADIQRMAEDKMEEGARTYIAIGAGDGQTLRKNIEAFKRPGMVRKDLQAQTMISGTCAQDTLPAADFRGRGKSEHHDLHPGPCSLLPSGAVSVSGSQVGKPCRRDRLCSRQGLKLCLLRLSICDFFGEDFFPMLRPFG